MIDRIGKELESVLGGPQPSLQDEPSSENSFQQYAKRAVAQAGAWVAAHPAESVGAAIAVGIAVGWWVKRR